MTSASHMRKGWCPGALRPMESGDGLLLRVKPQAGAFPISALAVIAKTASLFGSGEIDLTNRANFQLRGVSAETYPEAIAALDSADLIDDEAGAEAVRNVVVDPLSGADPGRADVRPFALRLEHALVADRAFWELPQKFGFSFSGSADPLIDGRSADIMLSAPTADHLVISIDAAPGMGAIAPADRVVDSLLRLAAVFLELRVSDAALFRMKDAVARRGSATIYAAAGLASAKIPSAQSHAPEAPPVGIFSHGDRVFAAGVGLPFGRIRADELAALYGVAQCVGIETVNTSPRRALVFPVSGVGQADAVLTEARFRGLIAEVGDPRLATDVCPGAPACRKATTDTRRDAQRLLMSLQERLASVSSLHISGCDKGCARRDAAALTLVARNGRYDIICDDGPGGPVAIAQVPPSEIKDAVAALVGEHVP